MPRDAESGSRKPGSEPERRRPGPPEPRVKIDMPWEEAAEKMIRTPPMPKGEKDGQTDKRRRR